MSTLTVREESNRLQGRKYGWIETLGTRRGFRGIGIGRALLLAGMLRLRAEGLDTALLGVDATNPTGATNLYRSVGFETVLTYHSYGKEL